MRRIKLGRCLLDDRLRDAGMTRPELQEKTGYSRSNVADWASTTRRKMTLPTAITIAEAIGCNVNDLYELIPVRRSKSPQVRSTKKTD